MTAFSDFVIVRINGRKRTVEIPREVWDAYVNDFINFDEFDALASAYKVTEQ